MTCRGSATPAGKTILGLIIVSLAIGPTPQVAASSSPSRSIVWQEHFESWVRKALVKDELDQAAGRMPGFGQAGTIRVLNQQVQARINASPDDQGLPPEVVAKILARGLPQGPVMRAARQYATGQIEQAIEQLQSPELESDPAAAHLLAQILDEQMEDASPYLHLENIADYRYALSLSSKTEQAERAHIRIGQIFLEIGLFPEARAVFRRFRKHEFSPPYDLAARVSLAETTYRDGDPKKTIDLILPLDLDALSPEIRQWAVRRTADSLYALGSYEASIKAYNRLIGQKDEGSAVSPLARLRLATALLATGNPSEAQIELKPILAGENSEEFIALAGLLFARSLRETSEPAQAAKIVDEVIRQLPDTSLTALAAVEKMESLRLAGESRAPAPPLQALAKRSAESPAFGLLSYALDSNPIEKQPPHVTRRKLGKLIRELPKGPVRDLVRSDLTDRLQEILAGAYRDRKKLDPLVLDDVEKYLAPNHINQDGLLLAIEYFRRAKRWDMCIRWGNTLYRRDVRPLRKGLGSWIALRCRRIKEPQYVSAYHLLRLADVGKTGAFSLALATLGAERLIRQGKLDRAIDTYETALQAIAEPRLLGPVLLRAGELEVYNGRSKMGQNHLLRGLATTERLGLAQDPFRHAGLVALAWVSSKRDRMASGIGSRLTRERKQADLWWAPALGYLGFRIDLGIAPRGDDVFSRAAQEFSQMDQFEKRVRDLVGSQALDAAMEKEKGG